MNERETIDALLACLPMSDDGTGHVTDCGYSDDDPACGCYTLPERLAAALRDHDAALVAKARSDALREAADWWHKQWPMTPLPPSHAEWVEGWLRGRAAASSHPTGNQP